MQAREELEFKTQKRCELVRKCGKLHVHGGFLLFNFFSAISEVSLALEPPRHENPVTRPRHVATALGLRPADRSLVTSEKTIGIFQ